MSWRAHEHDLEFNRYREAGRPSHDQSDDLSPLEFHKSLPNYTPTKLHELKEIARALNVRRIWAKDETLRFGLPSFKILGASWAIHRVLCDRLGRSPSELRTFADLRDEIAKSEPPMLIAATAGNHGRAVARVANLLSLESQIFVPADILPAKVEAIESEGASVAHVDGSFDEAVNLAAVSASDRRLVISDTSWPGYEQVPRWITQGYSTIFAEVDNELGKREESLPTHVMVQIGVGALGAAVVRHYGEQATLIGVESRLAACLLLSVRTGEPVSVEGPHHSIMSGLNAGVPSPIAWPHLRTGIDAFIAIEDSSGADAVALLARSGLAVGATGSAGLAGLLDIAHRPEDPQVRERLGINEEASILLLLTDGPISPPEPASVD